MAAFAAFLLAAGAVTSAAAPAPTGARVAVSATARAEILRAERIGGAQGLPRDAQATFRQVDARHGEVIVQFN